MPSVLGTVIIIALMMQSTAASDSASVEAAGILDAIETQDPGAPEHAHPALPAATAIPLDSPRPSTSADVVELTPVRISGKKSALGKLKKSAQAVTVVDLQKATHQAADLGEVMARTEGVNVQRAGGLGSSTRFALNGLSGDKVRFFYDGIPLNFTPYAFGISNVPVNALDHVEVYKGVVPIQFGADALGGAVNLVPPKVYDSWAGSASYQAGSFNTHRATAGVAYADDRSGSFVSAGGLLDATDNDYKIDVAIPGENGRLQPRTVKRFHDGYDAWGANVRTGILRKQWANELSLEAYTGRSDKEVQNSQSPGFIDFPELGIDKAVAGNPFGDVVFTRLSQGLNLRYNVNPAERWTMDLKAGINFSEGTSLDTSRCLYNWYGDCIRIQNQPGEFGDANHLITRSRSTFARQQVEYALARQHALKLSVAPTYTYQTGDDLLIAGAFDPALDKGYLFDLVSGLEYKGDFFTEKLQAIAFAKSYRQSVRIESLDPSLTEPQVDRRVVNHYGSGSGLRYAWTPRFASKLSYEYAYRLPQASEIFGDGQMIVENMELRPEKSHNVNLQWNLENKTAAETRWMLQGNFFLRRIHDLIFLTTDQDGVGSYQNVWSANSQGIELSGTADGLIDGLALNANSTYQRYFNTSENGPFAGFKGDRIPNTPYFFANAGMEYQLRDVIRKYDRLSFFWNTRYVHPYFIGWESSGVSQYKAEVPGQLMHAAGLTHRLSPTNLQNLRMALTLEVQNLTDAKAFDLYGVQRPGRAFYAKLTAQY